MTDMSRHGKYAEGTVRFQLAMPEELRDEMRDVARTEGVTVSEILREGAKMWMAARKKRK